MPERAARLRDVGEALHHHIAAMVAVDTHGPAAERARWAAHGINRARSALPADAVVVELDDPVVFGIPGGHVYVSRLLFTEYLTDAGLAFAIAHELAHRDLGHCAPVEEQLVALGADVATRRELTGLLSDVMTGCRYSPSQEGDADRRAVELCVAAGHDGVAAAMNYLQVLENRHLERPAPLHRELERPDEAAHEPSPSQRMFSWHDTPGGRALGDRRDALLQLRDAGGAEPRAALRVAPAGLAGTAMTRACARCAIRFSPAPRCPRCDSVHVFDLEVAAQRNACLRLLESRVVEPGRRRGLKATLGITATTVLLIAVAVPGGLSGGEALAGGVLLALFAAAVHAVLGRVLRDADKRGGRVRWLLARRRRGARLLEPAPAMRRLPAAAGEVVTVRGTVRVLRSVSAPLGGATCAAWRVVGQGPGGRIDDAGLGELEVHGDDGVCARVAGEALVDLPVDPPGSVAIEGAVEAFLRARGALADDGVAQLSEAVLQDGDEVEVTGVPTLEYVADGLRGTTEILAFRAGALVRG